MVATSRSRIPARAGPFVHFLVNTLQPYVDRVYRTRAGSEWTATMGSSLGGLISLYLGWKYPEVFGRIGGLSPTVMWSERKLFEHWQAHTRRWTRIYLDAGSGAEKEISPKMIATVRKSVNVPLIVGGGINTSQKAFAALESGADMIVIGNALEKNPNLLIEISDKVYEWNQNS